MNKTGKHALDVTELRVAVTKILKSSESYKPSTIEGEIGVKPDTIAIPCGSTNGICGRLIFELGGIPEKEMQKLRECADRLGKTSHAYAFYLGQQKVTSPKKVTHEMLFGSKQLERNHHVNRSKAVRELEKRKVSKKGHGQNF